MAGTTLIVCLFLGCVTALSAAPTDDACSDKIPDLCLNDVLIIGNSELQIPGDESVLDKFCDIAKTKTEPCVRDHIKTCLKSFPKQVATILVNSVIKELDLWCGDEKDILMGNAECLTTIKEDLDHCMKDFILVLDSISRHDDEDNIIPHACCEFGGFRQCALDTTRAACSEDTVEFIDKVISSYTSEIMGIACTSYQSGSSECEALPEVDFRAKMTNGTAYHSPLPPLLKLVQRL